MSNSFLGRCMLAVGLVCVTSVVSRAQVNITTPDTTLCASSPIALNATIGSSAGNFVIFIDDIYSPVFNLGFPFTFYGNTYTQCVISSNGFISFNLGNAGLISQWNIQNAGGVPGNPNCLNAIMGPYADIDPSEGGSIEYSTQGVAPIRRFVLTFCDVPMYSPPNNLSCNSLLARFQIVLFETSNTIEFHISNMPACPIWNNGAAIEGVQNATGTAAVTVPGRNYPGAWTAANSSHRFTPSGATYTIDDIGFQFYPTGLNNITWYENGVTTVGTGNSITVTPTAQSTFYIATAEGCIGTSSDTVTVNIGAVLPIPDAPSVTYCQNTPAVPLTATLLPGATAQWFTTPTGGTQLPDAPTPSTTAAGTTFYYVSQTRANCESERDTVQVVINPEVVAELTVDRDSICQDKTSTVTYTGTMPPGINYRWEFGEAIVMSGAGAGPYTLGWEQFGTKTIRIFAEALGCADSASVSLYAKEKPLASILIPLPDACVDDEREVLHTIVGGPANPTFNWDFNGGEIVSGSGAGPYSIRWKTSGEKVVTLITEKDGCFSDPARDTIPVYDLPLARIEAQNDRRVCIGDTLQLSAAAGASDDVYRWMPFSEFVTANYITNTRFAQYRIPRSGFVTLQVLSHYGCEARDSVYFTADACCQVFVPTAFSPNGDGRNDWFRIGGTERTRKVISIQVVNRWGQVVWREQDGRAGWNGLYQGEPQEPGVYQFLVLYECPDGKLQTEKGDVMLIR